jgi:predicted transposase/invertase (TIGR01784 family)
MARYLDPKNDLVFKKIFGEHPLLLQDFLNALLPLPDDGQIIELSYLPPEQIPLVPPENRRGIVDVKCTDQQGRVFIVEMQMYWTPSFFKRMLFNASQAFVMQLDPGAEYKLLQPVYALGIINAIFEQSEDWYHHYKIVNIEKTQRTIEGLQFVFIELPKFKAETVTAKKVRALWLRFLKEIKGELEPAAELQDYPPIMEALTISKEAAFSRAELAAYQSVMMAISNEKSIVTDSIELGIEKGIEIGREAGRQDEKLTIARNLLAVLDDKAIANITGLTLERVQKLRGETQ